MSSIYLDHFSATPLDPRVREAMLPHLGTEGAAPTSLHARGRRAATTLEAARAAVARLLDAAPEEILFTSSEAEANNLIVKGAMAEAGRPGRRLASATEPPTVLHPLRSLERSGVATAILPVLPDGRLDLDACRAALGGGQGLLSVSHASTEIGTLQPMTDLVAMARAAGWLLHADATAIAGRVPFVAGGRPDFEVIAPRLFNGPEGIAALRMAPGRTLRPLIEGGVEEGGLRAGALPLAAIAGFGRAAEIALAEAVERAAVAERLARDLKSRLAAAIPDLLFTGHPEERVPGHLSLAVRGVEAEALLRGLDEAGVEASSGSACLSGAGKPSHVLLACGIDPATARGGLTFVFGAGNRPEDPERVAAALATAAARLRALSPL